MLNPNKLLKGDRIYLKKPEKSLKLAEKVFSIISKNRNHFLPWTDWALPEITKNSQDSYNFILRINKEWKNKNSFSYFIYLNNKEFIGEIGCVVRQNHEISLGYWLSPEFCGNGYIQEAIKLIEEEFFKLGIIRFIIINDVENLASIKTAKYSGYKLEGVAKKEVWNKAFKSYRDKNHFAKIK